MKINFLKIFWMFLGLLVNISVSSQSQKSHISLPYHCGFEDSTENNNWIITSYEVQKD